MKELKLFDYQERFINSKEKLVIGNFARGMGKTFCLAQKIIKEKPEKVLIYAHTKRQAIEIIEKLKKLSDEKCSICENNGVYNVIWNNDNLTTCIMIEGIYFVRNTGNIERYNNDSLYILEDLKMINEDVYDIVIDQLLNKRELDSIQIICTTTENNYDKHIQKNYPNADIIEVDALQGIREGLFSSEVLMRDFIEYDDYSFYNNFAILSNPNLNKSTQFESVLADNNANNDFLDRTLTNLIKEYESIPVQNNTVMTRQNLLNMIISIENTRNCGVKVK